MKRRRSERLRSNTGTADSPQFEHALEAFDTGDGRGKGVRARQFIPKRASVLCYEGKLLTAAVGEQTEQRYAERGDRQCYMFWFHAGSRMCLDATEGEHISRLINHSKRAPNLVPRLVVLNGVPKIVFKAKRDISPGTELLFDYGDTRPDAVAANPWLLK